MPKKSSVSLTFRIAREDGTQELAAAGILHRLATGWAVTCKLPATVEEGAADDNAANSSATDGITAGMTLTIRDDEIRMNRSGAVKQEQLFRVGQWQRGMIGTAYGRLETEAWTYRLHVELAASGGTVEWEYDLRAADQPLGRSVITLHIREE